MPGPNTMPITTTTLHLYRQAQCALLSLVVVCLFGTSASAQTYRIESITVGRAAQYARSDGSIAAPRLFQQRLALRAHDLLNNKDGSLNAYLMIDYATDLTLEDELRADPAFVGQYNTFRLELAQLHWRPGLGLNVHLGRQWTWGALGFGDFDGIRLDWRLGNDHIKASLGGWFGQVANHQQGWLAHTTFDLQGLPEADLQSPLGSLVTGASINTQWADVLQTDLQYTRRWSTNSPLQDGTTATLLHDERLGAALMLQPFDTFNANVNGAYHLILSRMTDLRVDLAWQLSQRLTLTGGYRRQTPWFDTTSIFNLFEPRPHDDLYLNAQLSTAHTQWFVRSWARSFHGDDDTTDLGQNEHDANATGLALAHITRAHIGSRWIQWASTISTQWGDEQIMGNQLLVDSSLRTAAFVNNLFLTTRLLWLGVWHTHHRLQNEYATSAVIGLEYPILNAGQLSVFVEQHFPSQLPWRTEVYASLTVDFWP